MPSPHLDELNDDQRLAAVTLKGAYCCLSGAGTGKTRTLVARFNELLARGVPLENILCLTFTDNAAEEMAGRAGLAAGQRTFRTFHSYGYEIIHNELGIHDPDPRAWRKTVYKLIRKYGLPGLDAYKDLVGFISRCKRNEISPADAWQQAQQEDADSCYALAYRDYMDTQAKDGWIDFDDMIVLPKKLLAGSEELRAKYHKAAVQVDEAQDTDNTQWRIVQALSNNVFFVGDPNQAIYAWRGAHPENMTEFTKWFPGGKFLYLGMNYRSTKTIVDYCRKKAPIRNELIERLRSASGIPGAPIEYRQYMTPDQEAEAAIVFALRDPENSAILGRTNRLLATVQDICEDTGKKYILLGKSGYYQQPEIKSVMAFANFCITGSDAAFKGVVRSPFGPARFIKKKSEFLKHLVALQEMKDAGNKPRLKDLLRTERFNDDWQEGAQRLAYELDSLRSRVHSIGASQAIETIIAATDASNHYSGEDADAHDNYAAENINNLPKRAARSATLADFVEHVRKCLRAKKQAGAITLSTIHQAKGKEWNSVVVIGTAEGMLPHKNGDIDEEARIFYVAISRPKDLLRLSFCGTPSSFIKEELTDDILANLHEVCEQLTRAQQAVQLPLLA